MYGIAYKHACAAIMLKDRNVHRYFDKYFIMKLYHCAYPKPIYLDECMLYLYFTCLLYVLCLSFIIHFIYFNATLGIFVYLCKLAGVWIIEHELEGNQQKNNLFTTLQEKHRSIGAVLTPRVNPGLKKIS